MEFFHALGVPVIEGYGLTETASSASVNEPGDFRIGTVGRPVDGAEIRLADDGEILVRSDSVFAGYYKEPEATSAALTDDGWFRTGDVGEIDDEGFLKITDRKKDLIITAGGKNIAPQNLENALKTSRFVSQAVVVGDRRPYVTALVTLDEAELASSDRDPQELVQELVDDVNRDRMRVEQIKRFAILPRDFSQEEGEVTPTLKLRRRVIHEHFADEIEKLYARGLAQDALGAVVLGSVRAAEAVDPDDGAGVRRVDEVSTAHIDPDVAEPVEEDEVAGLELAPRHRDGIRVAPLRDGVVRQRDPDLGVRVHDETRAVEAAGARAAIDVRECRGSASRCPRRCCSGRPGPQCLWVRRRNRASESRPATPRPSRYGRRPAGPLAGRRSSAAIWERTELYRCRSEASRPSIWLRSAARAATSRCCRVRSLRSIVRRWTTWCWNETTWWTSVASCFEIELTVSMREIRSSRLLAPRRTASEDCWSPDV